MVQNQNNEQSQNQEQKDLHNSPKIFKIKRWKFIIFLIAIILITVILTVLSTIAISHKMSGLDADQRKSFKKVESAYGTLANDYYKHQNPDKLSEAAIDGMVKELKDPYSQYMTTDESKSFNEDVSGDFVGIGAEMQERNHQISVTSPMKGSPAEKAGLKPKDIVKKVNGKSIKGKPLTDVVKMVRGKKGTTVTLTIERAHQEHTLKIKRDKIHVKSVEYKKEGNVGIFTINKFQDNTASELKTGIKKAHNEGVRKIVLGLRNNPGGLLNEAVKMSNIFIDKNKPVVKLQKGNETEVVRAPSDPLKEAKDMQVSILVNEGSASASEVFTGAMKDYKKAKIYGDKTFGKGIVQTTKEYKDGSLLKYTEMKWLTPKGHYIHGKGIQPDVKISAPKYQSLSMIPDDKILKEGDNNKNVKSIKIGLKALNYNTGTENNDFDATLKSAVESFQKDNKLDVNGTFDKETNRKFTEKLVDKSSKDDEVLKTLLKKLK
ncbi:PDZ domain-containing protein [Staphylococcus condimenti]|uniref:Probable CtpA-like serine protease n=2 Tax=Staphylococcus condimenti TaxID=70255 RepID=A0AB37H4J6_9STAP|nr:S41 family peptidase [Staphylococcus condimenti]AMY04788.1 serine protease [Staphylococcus condimenti]PNZ65414.1 PDZ domain-containing protein [Staphylococcus condimenti]QQS83410.1 S41 family peptidase [Staphylococcus condimenti]QRP96542.1 S41 family peptidase [Staphylococcus condimenti]VEG64351.1 putative protease [Staphylococcus condimenti]